MERTLPSVIWYELRVAAWLVAGVAALWFLVAIFQPWAIGWASEFTFVATVLFAASVLTKVKEERGRRR